MDNLSSAPLWDLSLPPSLPALADEEFITLLQKQFGVNNGFGAALNDNDKESPPPTSNINPQNLTRIPIPRPVESPPSDDSSPSPNEPGTSRSRRQSGVFDMDDSSRQSEEILGDEDPSLKRKAGTEDLDNEPNYKTQHTSQSILKKNSTSRRKSTGNPSVDESRLLKRKEQNRAAQRAFRERKERHVKDLEDKVAALEEKNTAALRENENLREVVSRLQAENMRLRQSAFTFSVPTSTSSAAPANSIQSKEAGPSSVGSSEMQQDAPMNIFGSPPSATTSTTASSHDSPESLFANENHDNQLSFLGHNMFTLNAGQQQTATADAMNMDLGFGPTVTHTPYTTIASNPMFMSFREPDMFDPLSQQSQSGNQSQGGVQQNSGQPFDFSQQLFGAWPDVTMSGAGNAPLQAFDLTNSLDELFGASYNNNGAGLDFLGAPAKGSPTSSLSPVNHQNNHTSSPGASSSSSGSTSGSSPSATGGPEVPTGGAYGDKTKKCTREHLAAAIAQDGGSMFAPRPSSLSRSEESSPNSPASVTNANNTGGGIDDTCDEFPPCKGLQLPKTSRSEKNVEVMTAWRRIRRDPKFQDVDINQLCSEFASKARCDGCHVVIEPNGMQEILDSVQKAKRAKQHSQLFSASNQLLGVDASGGGGGGANVMSNPLNI